MSRDGVEYLIVDANYCDRELTAFDFAEHGISGKVHFAGNTIQALDFLFKEDGSFNFTDEPIKAIFLDLHMLKLGGFEFLRRIKSDNQIRKIPVVALKSSASPSDISECRRLGVSIFIEKPLEYENFLSAIKDIDR